MMDVQQPQVCTTRTVTVVDDDGYGSSNYSTPKVLTGLQTSCITTTRTRRKLDFSSTCDEMHRGARSRDAIRAKRKRYRSAKKQKKKEKWEESLTASMCARWKQRHLEYEKDVRVSEAATLLEQQEAIKVKLQKEQKKAEEKKCRIERLSSQQYLYNEIALASEQEASDALLLPSLDIPENVCSPELNSSIPANITGIDRVAVLSALQMERKKAIKAYHEAQHYRNLSERIRQEKRELSNTLNHKLEVVRDFWRSNVKEGSTRAGRILQMALTNNNNFS